MWCCDRDGVWLENLTSDNGLHFVNTFILVCVRSVCGVVERTHSMSNAKLTKITIPSGMDWMTSPPLALLYLRGCSSRPTGPSAFEIWTGHPMPVPGLPHPPTLEDVDGTVVGYT